MSKYTSIREFKTDLIRELDSFDPDTIRYAVSNSEEHLNIIVEEILKVKSGIGRSKAIQMALLSFGNPAEIAEVYRSMNS